MGNKNKYKPMRFKIDLLASHGKSCPYCNRIMRVAAGRKRPKKFALEMPTRDHVVPVSVMPAQGTLIVCHGCNSDKRNKTLPQWYAELVEADDPRAAFVRRIMVRNPHLKRKELHPDFTP